MERRALRGFLYLVMAFGFLAAIMDAHESRGNPAADMVCAVVALAGLAASAGPPEGPSPMED